MLCSEMPKSVSNSIVDYSNDFLVYCADLGVEFGSWFCSDAWSLFVLYWPFVLSRHLVQRPFGFISFGHTFVFLL